MKNLIVYFFIFSCLYPGFSYAAENERNVKQSASPEDIQRAYQQARPILPPVIPAAPPAVSPTPSPHVSAPPVFPQHINARPQVGRQVFSQPPITPNIPSAPAQIAAPNVPLLTDVPNVPMIGSAIGRVLNLGSDKKGVPWIEVKDDLFGEAINIKVKNLKNTPIIKQAAIMDFNDIKIGDMLNILFTNQDEENTANFISILTEEELSMMMGETKSESAANPPSSGE